MYNTAHDLPWDLFKRVHDMFASTAMSIVDDQKEVSPQIFVVGDPTGPSLPKFVGLTPKAAIEFFKDGDSKEVLMHFVESCLSPGNQLHESIKSDGELEPWFVVVVCEAWMTILDPKRPNDPAARERKEVLQVIVHAKDLSAFGMHMIETSPKRHCVPGEFPPKEQAMQMGGRMAMQERRPPAGVTRH